MKTHYTCLANVPIGISWEDWNVVRNVPNIYDHIHILALFYQPYVEIYT